MGSGLGAAILGARALGVVASLQEGYDLLRGEAQEERVVVSDAAAIAYEAMHHTAWSLRGCVSVRHSRGGDPGDATQKRHGARPETTERWRTPETPG